jgi:hypothetical protein
MSLEVVPDPVQPLDDAVEIGTVLPVCLGSEEEEPRLLDVGERSRVISQFLVQGRLSLVGVWNAHAKESSSADVLIANVEVRELVLRSRGESFAHDANGVDAYGQRLHSREEHVATDE